MPEGHTAHRYARRHRDLLVGPQLAVTSPQGRFARGAGRLDGHALEGVDAHGKHLFYRWEHGDVLHVHLGLFGRFRAHRVPAPSPSPGTRLAIRSATAAVYLAGPTICELVDPGEEEAIHARLGPDPLATPDASAEFVSALSGRRLSIAAALLDQSIVAGIGNVYRAELLFLCGIHPETPAGALGKSLSSELWSLAARELREGERLGRIVTVDPSEQGAANRRALPRGKRLYVYKRAGQPCRRCDTEIEVLDVGPRRAWFCPSCQQAA